MPSARSITTLPALHDRVTSCRRCPRLVAWRTRISREKVRRFAGERYWGKPLPGFGDPNARLLIVGLAPAAHGGNRTGRMFTGDRSGEWLYRALYKAGYASRPLSEHRRDGLQLTDCYVTAAVRCAPPANKPLPDELANCRPFLLKEIDLLGNIRVVVGLGRIGFNAAIAGYREAKGVTFETPPRFAHGREQRSGTVLFIASYHPSQQNTFTGRLTESMFDHIFRRAREAVGG